ncbi:MAG: M16 family metallopeptidase [Candidatus Zixiibacteriota bacterium]
MNRPYIIELDNGLKLVFVENHRYPKVEILATYRVGAIDEDDDHDGVSHFLEHLLFKGTSNRTDIELKESVAAIGGSINASTMSASTMYTLSIPASSIKEAIDLQADQLQNSLILKEQVERERAVVQEEIRISLDNPLWCTMEKMLQTMFKKHPLRRTILGSYDLIGSVPRDRIYNYYRHHYVPNNMAYIFVGDFEIAEIYPLLEEKWGHLASRQIRKPRLFEPQQTQPRTKIIKSDINQSVLMYGIRTPGIKDPDFHSIRAIISYLTSGRNSKLHKRLISEEKLAHSIFTYGDSLSYMGYFLIGVLAGDDADIEKIQKIIMEEIEYVKNFGMDDMELKRAKNRLLLAKDRSEESFSGIAYGLANDFATVGISKIDNERNEILDIDTRSVIRAANYYFSLSSRANWVINIPDRMKRPKIITSDKKLRKRFIKQEDFIKLDNGLHVAMAREKKLNLIHTSIVSRPSTESESPRLCGINNLALHSMLYGTKANPGESFDEEAANIGAIFGTAAWKEMKYFAGSVIPENIDRFLELFYEVQMEPDMSERAIEIVRHRTLKQIKSAVDVPMHYLFRRWRVTLFGNTGYGLPDNGFLENLPKIEHEKIRQYAANLINPAESLFLITGDFDRDEMLEKLNRSFGQIPSKPEIPLPNAEFVDKHDIIEESNHFQTVIALAAPGLPYENPSSAGLYMAMMILGSGLSSRFFKNIRDKESLAYFIGGESVSKYRVGAIVAYLGTAPQNEKQAISSLNRELELAANKGFTQDELDRAIAMFKGRWLSYGENPKMALLRDYADFLYGYNLNFTKDYYSRMVNCTLEEANNAASKYLKPGLFRKFIYRGKKPS